MTRQELLDFIRDSGGATNNQIAVRFNITPAYAATRTKQLFDTGYTTREPFGRTVSNAQILKHFAKKSVTPAMPKQERLKAEKPVGERLDNGGIGEMIQNLSDALAKQIAASVVVSLQASLTRELASVIPQHVPPVKQLTLNLSNLPPMPADSKPRIGVVGLMSAQEDAIEKEFREVFDLRYWKEDGVAALKAIGRACELVLVTKWCNHSATETLKSVGAKWRFVDGGLTELKHMLTALYVEK
jgi:hypothetical protein